MSTRAARRRQVRADRKGTKMVQRASLVAAVSTLRGTSVGWKAARKFLKRRANDWRRAIDAEAEPAEVAS